MYVRCYPRETQEMVFDAHERGFVFFGGVPVRGIYDNMETAVTTVFTGKDRVFKRRFLISFDRNRYSVMAKAARRPVQVRAYADRIVVRCGDAVVAEHPRHFGRNRTIYDPWHYLPVLARKPGALRNGAPFQGWELPPALTRLRRKLGAGDEADRRFVRVLAAVMSDGLDAVEDAIREALEAGAASDEVILNILARRREPPRPPHHHHGQGSGAVASTGR